MGLLVWFFNRNRAEPNQTATVATDQIKPDSGAGSQTTGAWTSASIADSLRSKGRVGFGDNDVRFATGSATLAGDSQAVLDQTAQALQTNPEWNLKVVGYTDATGSAATNQQLAQQRATNVLTYLTSHGVNQGSTCPLSPCW